MELDHEVPSNGSQPVQKTETVEESIPERLSEVPVATTSGSRTAETSSNFSSKPNYRLKYTMGGHTMSISSIKFSPDGSTLASAGMLHTSSLCVLTVITYLRLRKASDKLIKLWDSYTGKIIRTLEGHTEGISDIAWSNDSEYLASASDDKTIRIWKPDIVSTFISHLFLAFASLEKNQGNTVKVLKGHTNFVFCVNYNPRSNLLVSGGFDETVRVWDIARGK